MAGAGNGDVQGAMIEARLERIGEGQHPLVLLDGFWGDLSGLLDVAAALAPYPAAEGFYPGLRRAITPENALAQDYVQTALRRATPYIAGAFDIDGFTLLDASFSMVTADPNSLSAPQRAPHFDSTDPNYLALLHYVSGCEGSGTAFYRQRATRIEAVTDAGLSRFVDTARREGARHSGYIHGSNQAFEQIHAVKAKPDRLAIYQGRLLHSGVIAPGAALSANPREGRLTANIFLKMWRGKPHS